MAYDSFQAHEERQITPFDPELDHSAALSRRAYNLIMGGLVILGFAVMGACAYLTTTSGFLEAIYANYLPVMLGSTVLSVAGIFTLFAGMKREGLGLPLLGYALVVGSLGFTTGLILPFYSLPSIANAFVGTTLIAVLFTLLGAAYPSFFARIQGVAVAALFALLLVSVVGVIAGMDMSWLDYVMIVLFCGFIGYDTYRAQQCEPTVKMAILNAVNIWLDLINVFIRLLRIVGDRN